MPLQTLFDQVREFARELRTAEDLMKWEIAGKYMEKYDIYPAVTGYDAGGDCAYYAQLPKFISRDGRDTQLQCAAWHPLIAFWSCLLAYEKGVIRHGYTLCIST